MKFSKSLNILLSAGIFAGMLSSTPVTADEVAHGTWTAGFYQIEQVESYWSQTLYRIGEATSCGGGRDHYWAMPDSFGDATKDKTLDSKKAMLFSAFAAKKWVKLRCEKGYISDFIIHVNKP